MVQFEYELGEVMGLQVLFIDSTTPTKEKKNSLGWKR